MKNNNNWLVYVISHPVTYDIIYIGITTDMDERYRKYFFENPERLYVKYFKLLTKNGLIPKMNLIKKSLSLSDALRLENQLMREYTDLGFPLLNGNRWVKSRWPNEFLDNHFLKIIPERWPNLITKMTSEPPSA